MKHFVKLLVILLLVILVFILFFNSPNYKVIKKVESELYNVFVYESDYDFGRNVSRVTIKKKNDLFEKEILLLTPLRFAKIVDILFMDSSNIQIIIETAYGNSENDELIKLLDINIESLDDRIVLDYSDR